MRAAPHPSQADRLAALRRYNILDTPREAEFDEIVELASQICNAPISVINLIDESRQWFKAEVGLNARETPLETSLCSHVILDEEFVEIPDTLRDPRMADNPLCLGDLGLRFYAGAQLLSSEGLPIGTLCILDNQPRKLTDLQRNALRVLSRQVMKQIELRLALRNQDVLRSEMDHRIKNSLQSVSSVLRLFRRHVTDPTSGEALDAVQRRMEAIIALHEALQGSRQSDEVDLSTYLTRVTQLLQASAPDHLQVTCNADAVLTDASRAASLGMILSEFVANSIKHGFPDGRAGQVDITLRKQADGSTLLTCRDNGIGSAAKSVPRSDLENLGFSLVEAAASQLDGNLDTTLDETGSRLTLEF